MMTKMEISDVELDVLVKLFEDLFQESLHQGELSEKNGDKEELQTCAFLSNLYLKMFSYLYHVRGNEEHA